MSILTQLFGGRQNGTKEDQVVAPEEKITIDKQLFVDEVPPTLESIKPVSNWEKPKPRTIAESIKAFAESNLSARGFDSGYKYHSPDLKKSILREIKSEFQALLRLEIDRLRVVLGDLKSQVSMLNYDEMMEANKAALENRIVDFNSAILRLEEEILLAEDGLGMIRKPVDSFSQGFTKGYQLYLTEDLLNQQYGLS